MELRDAAEWFRRGEHQLAQGDAREAVVSFRTRRPAIAVEVGWGPAEVIPRQRVLTQREGSEACAGEGWPSADAARRAVWNCSSAPRFSPAFENRRPTCTCSPASSGMSLLKATSSKRLRASARATA